MLVIIITRWRTTRAKVNDVRARARASPSPSPSPVAVTFSYYPQPHGSGREENTEDTDDESNVKN